MRLLYFTRSYTDHDRRFLQAFREQGIEVGYLILQQTTARVDVQSMPPNTKLLGCLGVPSDPSTSQLDAIVPVFEQCITLFAPNIVLAGPLSDCSYIVAKAKQVCPWVAKSWAFDVLWESKRSADVAQRVRIALHGCSALFADCRAVVTQCERIAGQSMPSRYVMPWGIDLTETRQTRPRESIRRELGVSGRKVFLHTRGLEPIYSVETLLDAIAFFCRAHSDALFLLASDGSMRPIVEKFMEAHGLHQAVRLLGAVTHDRVLDLFCAADCYVSCAVSDGTSISLLEAMACGLPPIVTEIGGNPEWVHDGQNGWVVPPGDVDRLTQAMAAAGYIDPESRRRMVMQNRKIVETKANWTNNFSAFGKFLEIVCAYKNPCVPVHNLSSPHKSN